MAGQPTLFTPELGRLLIQEARRGTFVAPMARLIGVDVKTVHAWIARGKMPNAPPLLAAFSDAFCRADAEWEAEQLDLIQRAARPAVLRSTSETTITNERGTETRSTIEHKTVQGDAKAAQWLLSKKYPKRYGDAAHAQLSAGEHVPFAELQDAAESRADDINSLLAEPPPELEDAIRRNRDSILAILSLSEPEAAKTP